MSDGRLGLLLLAMLLAILLSAISSRSGAQEIPTHYPKPIAWTMDPSPDPAEVAGVEVQWRDPATDELSTWLPVRGVVFFDEVPVWHGAALFPSRRTVRYRIRLVDTAGNVTMESNEREAPNPCEADLNHDGGVGGPDFGVFRSLFGRVCANPILYPLEAP